MEYSIEVEQHQVQMAYISFKNLKIKTDKLLLEKKKSKGEKDNRYEYHILQYMNEKK